MARNSETPDRFNNPDYRYIRDPKSIRSWDDSKMPGFGPETFSDEDIANVVAYLKEMALEKSPAD